MLEKLKSLNERFDIVSELISDAEVIADRDRWRDLCREHSELSPIIDEYNRYKELISTKDEDKALLESETDKELLEMLRLELEDTETAIRESEDKIKLLLIPKVPNDEKNVIMEIRGGTGGEEAALFAGSLMRMYSMYADTMGWKLEILSSNPTELGGYKEISFLIEGKGAYSRLKYESGVHRVQRVPETESGGRIHTSAVTVAVLPEIEEIEFEINKNDIRIDVFRAGGPGGQCVNTRDSALRIPHLPTGIVVSCQDEKSQLQNKEKAMKILRSRIFEAMEEERNRALASERKSQVGSGDRSERIRTYNFPQSRITDHRINLTIYRLEQFLDGDLDEVIDALITSDRAAKLSAGEN